MTTPHAKATATRHTAHSSQSVLKHLKHLPKDSIIFLDVDDTIITPASTTFRAPPYNKMIDTIKDNKHQYSNYEEILSNWRLQRQAILIDPTWPKVIDSLKAHYQVFGLTKMDSGQFGNIPSMEAWRYEELRSLGIEFSQSSDMESVTHDTNASFYKGIFITGKHTKAMTLAPFHKHLNTTHIVMVDDRRKHLDEISLFCNKHNINYQGILFNGLENLSGKPNPDIAKIQKEYLIKHAKWLSDKEAVSYM